MAFNRQIHFHFLSPVTLRHRTHLKIFLVDLFQSEKKKLEEANFIFCDDAYLLSINQQYLNHNTFTDIITFPYASEGEPVRSDIFISVERTRENAKTFNTPHYTELLRVIFHGCLHLCGYRDKTPKDQAAMRAREDYYLSRYVVSRETN